jgi:hypothetical protein
MPFLFTSRSFFTSTIPILGCFIKSVIVVAYHKSCMPGHTLITCILLTAFLIM